MVETITPVVHGGRRRWAAALALHALGAAGSAAAFGAVLGAIGGLFQAPWGATGGVVVAVVAALYAARELAGVPVPVPERRKQVPEWWRTFFPWPASSALYGMGLGIGYLTFLRYGTLVAVTAGAVVTGEPLLGAAVMAPFGLARGLSVAVAGRGHDGPAVRAIVERLETVARSAAPRIVNGLALFAVAALALAGADRLPGAPGGGLAVALGVVFGWAAVAKALSPADWTAGLRRYGLPGAAGRAAAFVVPIVELAVPGLVLAGYPRLAGVLALGLLVVFSAAILRAKGAIGERLPCACFGRSRWRDYRILLLRNAALAGLAVVVALHAPAVHLPAVRAPSGTEWLAAALAGAGLILAAVMLRVSRVLGRS
jgi:hypothetical protein